MTTHDLAWKGRLIITQDGHVDLPPDRQEIVGPTDSDDRRKFIDLLNDAMPQDMLFGIIKEKLRSGEIRTREAGDVVLFDDDHEGTHWLIQGNTNASAGYFYVEARIVAEPAESTGDTLKVPTITTREELDAWLAEVGKDGYALSLVTEALDVMVHEVKAHEAAEINNGGVPAQVQFLMEINGDSLVDFTRDLRDTL